MHVRLQSWFPFEIQIWVNGRQWLARQLDREGIGYQRYDNTFLHIDDLSRAQKLCARLERRRWPRVLDVFARSVNPMLRGIRRAGFGGYYWVADQAEYATDIMFKDRRSLNALAPSLVDHAAKVFGAEDIFRFRGVGSTAISKER